MSAENCADDIGSTVRYALRDEPGNRASRGLLAMDIERVFTQRRS